MSNICIVAFLNYCMDGGTVDMVISLMKRSRYKHVYLTYKASDRRKEQFQELGLDLIEIGENYDEAVRFVKQNASIMLCSSSGGPEPGVSIGLEANVPIIEICQSPSLPGGSIHPSVHVIPVSKGILAYWPEDVRYDRVIYSCAEPIPSIDKKYCKQQFGLNPNKFVLGRVGRLEGLKRPQDFVNMTVELNRQFSDYEYFLVGDGADGDGVRGMVKNVKAIYGIDIVMPGFLTGERKNQAYNAIDLFVYPSSMEGFGIAFAEAMSLGIPIVTYADPVNLDVVAEAGVFGVDNVFERLSDTYKSLVDLTIDLTLNKREYNKHVEWGKKRYNRFFTPERMAREYEQLYKDILSV